ncbi:hypothetical protein ACHAW5_004329 [Stephanodiscus triporus]|uniref:Peptidase S49 domain-containing protein n=1 Tax=Stephanodiscus triporus TaxID=2934178 RepID=A0ABD3MXH9_9STRA
MASFAVKLRQQLKSTSCTLRSHEENVGGIVRTAFTPRFRFPSSRRPLPSSVSTKNDGDASANFPFTSTRSSGVRRQKKEQEEQEQSRIASIEAVVGYLSDLAKLPPPRLWDVLGMDTDEDYGDDPFALKSLEGGQCPWQDRDIATAAPWLPPRPLGSNEIAATYRLGREKATKGRGGFDVTDDVALWYEHISKAGGTTFCGLARSNMEQWQVPEYHCMPGKGDLMDGHVGKWTNDELLRHFAVRRHAIVSSEWDPFRSDRLALSGRGLDGSMSASSMPNDGRDARIVGPRLLFLTTLRDPCDRLLSAYTFFMITRKHNAKNYDPPPFLEWMAGNTKRAAKYERGTGKRYGLIGWTTNHNHVTWRFSGGMLPPNIPREDVQEWVIPYEVAIRALCQFDLILPMDVMTKDGLGKAALKRLLGWTNFEARVSYRPGDDDIDGDAKNGHVHDDNDERMMRPPNARSAVPLLSLLATTIVVASLLPRSFASPLLERARRTLHPPSSSSSSAAARRGDRSIRRRSAPRGGGLDDAFIVPSVVVGIPRGGGGGDADDDGNIVDEDPDRDVADDDDDDDDEGGVVKMIGGCVEDEDDVDVDDEDDRRVGDAIDSGRLRLRRNRRRPRRRAGSEADDDRPVFFVFAERQRAAVRKIVNAIVVSNNARGNYRRRDLYVLLTLFAFRRDAFDLVVRRRRFDWSTDVPKLIFVLVVVRRCLAMTGDARDRRDYDDDGREVDRDRHRTVASSDAGGPTPGSSSHRPTTNATAISRRRPAVPPFVAPSLVVLSVALLLVLLPRGVACIVLPMALRALLISSSASSASGYDDLFGGRGWSPTGSAYLPSLEQHYAFEQLNERYFRDWAAYAKARDTHPTVVAASAAAAAARRAAAAAPPGDAILGDGFPIGGAASSFVRSLFAAVPTTGRRLTTMTAATGDRTNYYPSVYDNGTVIVLDMTGLDARASRMEVVRDQISFLIHHLAHSAEEPRRDGDLATDLDLAISPPQPPPTTTTTTTTTTPSPAPAGPTVEVIVLLESPGGGVSQYGLAASHLHRLRSNPNVKLTICVDTVAASGGYMMACQATPGQLYCAPFAMVGSIGVIGQSLNIQKTLEGYGIRPYIFRGGKMKNPVGMVGDVTRDGVVAMQQMIDRVHDAFRDHVASARGDAFKTAAAAAASSSNAIPKPSDDYFRLSAGVDQSMSAQSTSIAQVMDQVATGDIFLGVEALKLGLVDRLITSDEYISERILSGARVLKLINYRRPTGLSNLFSVPPYHHRMHSSSLSTGTDGVVRILKKVVHHHDEDMRQR